MNKKIIQNNLILSLFILTIITLPLHVSINHIFLISLLFVVLTCFDIDELLKNKFTILSISSIFILSIISISYSDNFIKSFEASGQKIAVFLIPLLIFSSSKIQYVISRNRIRITCIFVISLLIYAIICWSVILINIIILDQPFNYLFRWRYSGSNLLKTLYISSNYFSILFNIGTIFLIWLKSKNCIKQSLFIILIILFSIFQFHMMSRMSLMIYFIILGIGLIYLKKWKIILLVSGISIAFLSYTLQYDSRISHRINALGFDKLEFNDNRIKRWRPLLEMVKNKPLIGYGDEYDETIRNKYYLQHDLKSAVEKNYNAHNQYLEILLSYGVIGLILFTVGLGYLIIISIYNRKFLTIMILSIFCLNFITESILERNKGRLMFSIFITASMCFNLKDDTK